MGGGGVSFDSFRVLGFGLNSLSSKFSWPEILLGITMRSWEHVVNNPCAASVFEFSFFKLILKH